MIQPADNNEKLLLSVLRDLPAIKELKETSELLIQNEENEEIEDPSGNEDVDDDDDSDDDDGDTCEEYDNEDTDDDEGDKEDIDNEHGDIEECDNADIDNLDGDAKGYDDVVPHDTAGVESAVLDDHLTDEDVSQGGNPTRQSSQHGKEVHIAAENLRVTMPPLSTADSAALYGGDSASNTASNHGPKQYEKSTQTVIDQQGNITVNELLCFIFHKMKSLPNDIITQLCISFYEPEYIASSKELFFKQTESLRLNNKRHIKRLGINRKRDDINDILKVFRSLETKDIPVYVAQDLGKLPPLGAFDMNVIQLQEDLNKLKQDMSIVHQCNKSISEIAKNIDQLKAGERTCIRKCTCQTHCASAGAERIRTPSMTDTCTSKDKVTHTVISSTKTVRASKEAPLQTNPKYSNENTTKDPPDTISQSYASVVENASANINANNSRTVIRTHEGMNTRRSSNDSGVKDSDEAGKGSSSLCPPASFTDDTWQVVTTKRSAKSSSVDNRGPKSSREADDKSSAPGVQHGTRHTSNLKTVKKHRRESEYIKRSVTGVFISRLERNTSSAQVAVYVLNETGLTVHPEKLRTKHDGYSSFAISCNSHDRKVLMSGDVWPIGALL